LRGREKALASAPASRRHSHRRTLCVAAGLLLGGLAIYGNSLRNPFVIDDHWIIERDARVVTGDVWALLTQQYWAGEHGDTQLYRPLVLISFAANRAISQEVWTFRIVNLLLHVAVALAVYLLMWQVTGMHWASVLAAVLFLVHPIHATVLNQVVDRADLAAAACVLLAAWLYAGDGGRGRLRPLLVAGLLAIGLLCKENAVTLVGLFVLLDLCAQRHAAHKAGSPRWPQRAVRYYVPALGLVLAYLVLRFVVLGGVARGAEGITPLDNIIARPEFALHAGDSAFMARWGTPVAVVGRAARLLIWPQPLSWDWSYAAIDAVRTWSDPALWTGVGVLALCAAGIALSLRRRRLVCLSLGLALITYSVVSNTFILIGSAFAERYLYLPSAGFCMLAALLAAAGFRRARRASLKQHQVIAGLVMILTGVAIFGGAARIYLRNRDFASDATLNAADLRSNPRSARLWSAVASDEYNANRYQPALEHARAALAICPVFADPWRIAGLAQYALKNSDEALTCLQKSFEFGGQDNQAANVHAAKILTQRGEYAPAITLLRGFVERHPQAATPRNNLAWYLLTAQPADLRDLRSALKYAREAVALEPRAGDFVDTYAAVLEGLGQHAEAQHIVRDGLARIPANDPARPELLRRLQEP
jgi:protein O-mannosyl-transferase